MSNAKRRHRRRRRFRKAWLHHGKELLNVVTVDHLKRAVRALKDNNVPPTEGKYFIATPWEWRRYVALDETGD